MTTPAHTPGPWKTSETVHSDGYTGKHYWTIYPQHAPADIIVALPVASDKENDRAEANARLIASAPTLAREHAEMRERLEITAHEAHKAHRAFWSAFDECNVELCINNRALLA